MGGVAGAYSAFGGGCVPSRPVPAILFHGTADRIVPYGGGMRGAFPALEDFAADWAARNGCDLTPVSIEGLTGDASGIRYGSCDEDAEVVLYTIDGGGHTWPGGGEIPSFLVGATTQDIDASATMWEFFERFPLAN
jgi:polyhydroxybutyrate depolymerase